MTRGCELLALYGSSNRKQNFPLSVGTVQMTFEGPLQRLARVRFNLALPCLALFTFFSPRFIFHYLFYSVNNEKYECLNSREPGSVIVKL